jgi:hypothetical protein
VKSTEFSEVGEPISRREMCSRIEIEAQQAAEKRTKREQAVFYEKAALETIAAWVKIRSLAPIVSSNPDPDPIKRSERLSYPMIDWVCDIESATSKALANLPNLQLCWFDIALEKPVIASQRYEVLQKCGREYSARELMPWVYWQRSRRKHQ